MSLFYKYCICLEMVDKSDDESDVSSVSELSVNNNNQKEENAIFIRNLPATAHFKDVFDVFSKVGRIKVCSILT
jgi:RNA recognition motif-containing protein